MIRARSQTLLWTLCAVLLMALPLLATLQVRWAKELQIAEIERVTRDIEGGIETFRSEIERQMLGWSFELQANPEPLDPLSNPRLEWGGESALGDLIHRVYLIHPGDDSTPAGWYRLPAEGPSQLLEQPVPELEQWLSGSGVGPVLLPATIDDDRLALKSILATGPLPVRFSQASGFCAHCRSILVTLDRSAFERWIDDLAEAHWQAGTQSLGYSLYVTGPGSEETLLIESPSSGAEASGAPISQFAFEIDLQRALGEVLAMRASPCGGGESEGKEGTCPDVHPSESEETHAVFLAIPSGEQFWRFNVQMFNASLDPSLRSLWARNFGIGIAALVVLAVAVALLVGLTLQSQRLARAQFDFVTGVTHELQTPLSVMRSAAANLADGLVADAEHAQRYGRVLRKEVARLSETVDRILGFARAQNDGIDDAATDLAVSLERVIEGLRGEIGDREVELEIDLEDGLPAVKANAWLLESILQNLLSNALKYGGGRVRVEAREIRRRGRRAIALTVKDWGGGLSRSERRRIFEPFFRGRGARAAQLPGTGLGLPWVARLVGRAGGRLITESKVGEGSRFGVELPVAGAAE